MLILSKFEDMIINVDFQWVSSCVYKDCYIRKQKKKSSGAHLFTQNLGKMILPGKFFLTIDVWGQKVITLKLVELKTLNLQIIVDLL